MRPVLRAAFSCQAGSPLGSPLACWSLACLMRRSILRTSNSLDFFISCTPARTQMAPLVRGPGRRCGSCLPRMPPAAYLFDRLQVVKRLLREHLFPAVHIMGRWA